ncbi:MAG: P-loop NTPase [Candidatus Woesearchaeota archaeon]|nr:P-loop NTPase [Candidatus Woesearchaeota archaeon]
MAKRICILSGKGGVGKTFVSLNIASAFNAIGRSVILLDADMNSPDLSTSLNMSFSDKSLQKAISGSSKICDCVHLHSSGLKVIPSGLSECIADSSFCRRLKFSLDELDDKAELLIIDGTAGLSGTSIALASLSDAVIIVTTPEKSAVFDSLKIVRALEGSKKPIRIIINMNSGLNFEMDRKSIEALLEKRVILEIPSDPEIKKTIGIGQPIVFYNRESNHSRDFLELAKSIVRGQF